MVRQVYDQYPPVVITTCALFTAILTRRCKRSTTILLTLPIVTSTKFGLFRNAVLGGVFASAFLYPQQFVNLLLRPRQFFDSAYDGAIRATVAANVEKPAWEEFKEKATAAEEKVIKVAEQTKEQVKEEVTKVIEDLKTIAEHVQEGVKAEQEVNKQEEIVATTEASVEAAPVHNQSN
jgi:hypothetical protein